MNLQHFFDKYYFHDSVVENLTYFSEQQSLILELDLCNYMQEDYDETKPETIKGKLVFTGVSNLTANPNINEVKWDENNNGQILDVLVSNLPNNHQKQVKIILEVTDYKNDLHEVFVLEFLAIQADWVTI